VPPFSSRDPVERPLLQRLLLPVKDPRQGELCSVCTGSEHHGPPDTQRGLMDGHIRALLEEDLPWCLQAADERGG
jgi:hypothetical protein